MPVETRSADSGARWFRRMTARGSTESHRTATPLELLFDLCFVVAVALAAAALHHELSEDHARDAAFAYVAVFFSIWWAWMNFTWFASAYDTDDVPYRVAAFIQIAGVLVVAAGVPRAFDDSDFTVVTIGYAVMRSALAAQWLRAGRGASAGSLERRVAFRYAAGVTACLAGWVVLLQLPDDLRPVGFGVMVLAELALPIWAERGFQTAWHPRHIAERFGLFTIIVLGESVLSATTAVQIGIDSGEQITDLLVIAGCGLVILFGMWWVYFDQPAERFLVSNRVSFVWGYGHYLIFASAAAVGAGLAVASDEATHHAEISATAAEASAVVPVAVFLASAWVLHVRPCHHGRRYDVAFLLAVVLVLASLLTPVALPLTAAVLVLLVAATVATT